MALIHCPDCQTECSDLAPACPKCGRPLGGQKSFLTKDIGLGGVIFVLLVIAGLLVSVAGEPLGLAITGAGALLLFLRLKAWSGVERK